MLKKLSYAMPDLKDSWIIVFLLFVGQFAVSALQILLFTVMGINDAAEEYERLQSILLPFTYAIGYTIPFLYVYWKGLKRMNNTGVELPPYREVRIERSDFGRMRLWTFIPVVLVVETAFIFLVSSLPRGSEMPEWMEDTFMSMYGTNLVSNLLCMGVIAPLLEELLFRGVILGGLLRRMDPWWAILWSSVIFAVAHLNPWQAMPAFLMGCLFGWIYYRTGSYWTIGGMHAFNNVSTILLTVLLGPEVMVKEDVLSLAGAAFVPLLIVSALLAAGGIWLLYKYLPTNKNNSL